MQKEEKGEKRILETETEIREHSRSRSTVLNGAMIRMQTSHWISNKLRILLVVWLGGA